MTARSCVRRMIRLSAASPAALRPIRIGRGSAPRELHLPWRHPTPLLAAGGHMKGTVALAWEDRVVVSPHIGEMDSPRSLDVFEQVANDLQALYGVTASRIACDAHPGYTTHRWAEAQGLPCQAIWHHEAHASAVVAEHGADGDWIVFAWDGVGLGRDGSLWGGEALVGHPGQWRREASLRSFRLPGGDKAGREPWRSAAALLWGHGEDWQPPEDSAGARAPGLAFRHQRARNHCRRSPVRRCRGADPAMCRSRVSRHRDRWRSKRCAASARRHCSCP